MIRRALAALAIAAAVAAIAGCDTSDRLELGHSSLPGVFGARVTDGQLQIWTGTPCTKVDRVSLDFYSQRARLVLKPPAGQWAAVDHFPLDGPYPGFEVVTSLPGDFDWRAAQDISLSIRSQSAGPNAVAIGSAELTSVTKMIEGSADHPDDTYYFEGFGWLNPAQVAEQNRTSLLTVCTPDPARELSLPPAFGARVTDGTLRIWAGSPCTAVNGVTLIFSPDTTKPATIELAFGKSDSPVNFEYYTLGEPIPGMETLEALPVGFDWRNQDSLQLSVHTTNTHNDPTTTLAEVMEHSADHPEDTYWFQGVGWLNPGQVAEQDGKTFLTTCTEDPAKK